MNRVSYIDEIGYRDYMNRLWKNSGLPGSDKPPIKKEKVSGFDYYAVFMIAIAALALVLSIPFFLNRKGYGTWVTEQGPCIPNSNQCRDGGVKRFVTSCIPSSVTGYGCLKDGRMTYDSYYEDIKCNVSCYSAEWKDIQGPCIDGLKITKHQCVTKDQSGPSNCIRILDYIPEIYNVGYTYDDITRCSDDTHSSRWVLLDNAEALVRDQWISIHNEDLELVNIVKRYLLSDRCDSRIVLGEGRILYTPAIERNSKYFIPSNPNDYELTTPVPNNVQECRYMDSRYSYIVPNIDDRIMTVANLPSSTSVIPFINYVKEGRDLKHLPVEIVLSRSTTLPGCSQEQIVFDTSVHLIPIPTDQRPQRLKTGRYNCYIACMASRGFHGVLGMRESRLVWEAMPTRTDSYIRPLDSTTVFDIDLQEISENCLLMTLRHSGMIVRVRNKESEQMIDLSTIIVRQYRVGSEGWERKCDLHKRL